MLIENEHINKRKEEISSTIIDTQRLAHSQHTETTTHGHYLTDILSKRRNSSIFFPCQKLPVAKTM